MQKCPFLAQVFQPKGIPSMPYLDELSKRIEAEIRSRWIELPIIDRQYHTPPDEVDSVSKAALDAILVRKFRVTKLPDDEERRQLFSRVRYFVRRSRPIQIRLGYAPMKNQNAVTYSHCDWSEFFAFCLLAEWYTKVVSAYPPGLQIKLVFDDASVLMANKIDRRYMDVYIQSIRRLIHHLQYETLFVGVIRHTWFSWIFNFGLYQLADYRVRRWEADVANKEQIEKMAEYAQRNLIMAGSLGDAERRRRFMEASHRYRVYFEALGLSGLTRLGNSIVGMYMNGAQHHIPIRPALHLATLRKEFVTQPWQGAGALESNSRGRLLPYVATTSRMKKESTISLTHLDVIPLPGFDRIEIAQDAVARKDSGVVSCEYRRRAA